MKIVMCEDKEWQYDAEMVVWRCRRRGERLLDVRNGAVRLERPYIRKSLVDVLWSTGSQCKFYVKQLS
jgi:hypothetical protein